MKPIATDIDKDSMSWNLSWQPDGRCNSFTRESILAYAPPSSGVYGLFNFNCQVLIGESANIQQALLRHESETDFQSEHLRPTGFTFEAYDAESRRTKADELIAKFRPVLQAGAALSETQPVSGLPIASEADRDGGELRAHADHQQFPAHEERPAARRAFQLKRTPRIALEATLVAVVLFYFTAPADYATHQRADGANPDQARQKSEATPAKPALRTAVSSGNAAPRRLTKAAPATDRAGIQPKTSSTVQPRQSADATKKWSVQVAAAPSRDIADTLAQQLKIQGYDSYVVQATVKGQSFYRVRIGHFGTREQAESTRLALASQEAYRDAYLTGD